MSNFEVNPESNLASRNSLVVTDAAELQGNYPPPPTDHDYENHLDNNSTESMREESSGNLDKVDGILAEQGPDSFGR